MWCNTLPEDNCLKGFIRPELRKVSGRQGLPSYYRINGAIYLIRGTDAIEDLYGEKSFAYIMDRDRSIDIDNLIDFRIAEIIMANV